ncbi:MAG: sigma-70 family RNA polymerase sigma factor [Planctomycetaceae bacterium]|nr:sigma-70 family RNA polymerase sigma factor [Planctomycetaceae bacterium]
MVTRSEFEVALQKLRDGSPDAVAEFVQHYQPFIRRAVRRGLTRSGLRSVVDSSDICQSVLASFLVRMAAGEFEFRDQKSVENLLITIARRRLGMLVRHETAQGRDRRRLMSLDSRWEHVAPASTDPGLVAEVSDLLQQVRSRMTDDERRLFDLRRSGAGWDTISQTVHENPVALRKRLSRALHRICSELDLDHESDESSSEDESSPDNEQT